MATRDSELQRAFEAVDDSLTATLGYNEYSMAAYYSVSKAQTELFPDAPASIQITHDWARVFNAKQLESVMASMYDIVSARLSLVLLVSYFEPGLTRMMGRISQQGKDLAAVPQSYKQKLKWAFQKVAGSTYGTSAMQGRVPELCLDVDHARRLRNLLMHNGGFFDQLYETDGLHVAGRTPLLHPDYFKFAAAPSARTPLLLSLDEFRKLTHSHIEFAHHIHDVLQREYFGCTESCGYQKEGKVIEWHRLLIGA